MEIPASVRSAARTLNTPWAVLVGALLIVVAVLVAVGEPRSAYLPNPQGGIWVRTSTSLYLCVASREAPAPCIDMQSGANVRYADLELHP